MTAVRAFQIPVESGNKIVYIPQLRTVRLVPQSIQVPDLFDATVETHSTERAPDGRFPRCDLVLNNFCNLRCIYCHANSGTQQRREMPFPIACQAIDQVAKDAKELGLSHFDVTLTGGGEPLLSLRLVRKIVAYCRQKESETGLRCKLAIVSNGCFSSKLRRFIVDNFTNISISIDGPPMIQNKQRPLADGRPSFNIVAANIDALSGVGTIGIGFRMTVSAESVNDLEDNVLFLHRRWPNVVIGIEPLEYTGRCIDTNAQPPDLRVFAQQYVGLLAIAKANNLQLRSSLATFKSHVCRLSFCGVNGRIFGIDPEGNVTACTRVSDSRDPLAACFHYGKITPHGTGPEISGKSYQQLAGYTADSVPQCHDCYAMSNCKGDCCHVRASAYGAGFARRVSHRCEGIRFFTRAILRMELGLPPEPIK
ncbi:MAG: radical SAM protein [Patescibacteria group bacterium]